MGYVEAVQATGIKPFLSWAQGRCWNKKVSGKQLYFKTPNTAAGYEAALKEWAKSQELPEPPDPHQHRPFLRKVIEWYQQNGDSEERVKSLRHFLDAKSEPVEKEFRRPTTDDVLDLMLGEMYAKDELKNRRLWNDRFDQPTKKKGLTIQEAIARFLAEQLQKVHVGKRSPSTYGGWVDRLKHTQNNLSGLVESIKADAVSNYYKKLTSDTKLGGQRQKNIFKAFKSFVRWAWQEELLAELPRNINKTFEFAEDSKGHAWMLYSPAEIKSMMQKLPVRGRAAVMLGLNLGFTVGDMADLKKSNVDLKAGRIVYKRVKTRGRKHTPTINYKLWPETRAVLEEYQSEHPEYWFLTEDGRPLKESKIVQERESKWSALACQWGRWKANGDVPQKPQKGLRKTSATAIESTYPGWEETFLGHAPTSIAGKHYVVKGGQANPEFDKILDWLRVRVLGVTPTCSSNKARKPR